MNSLEHYLNEQLATREAKGILRRLKVTDSSLVDFTSNDYLGLASSKELRKQIEERVEGHSPWRNGSTGSRLLSGNSNLYEQLENQLARLFKAEACLIFNSG